MTVRIRHSLLLAPFAVLLLATAAEATTTIPIKSSQVPVQASQFDEHGDCSYPGLADESPPQYGWHFVLPGNDPTFVSLTAHFADAGDVTLPGPDGGFVQSGKGAVIYTSTDDTLTGATAEINGTTTQGYFVLSDTCVPTPSETPSATVSATATETASGTPSATVSATETETASGTPSASETPSAEVSGTQFTQSASESVSPSVLGVKLTKGGVAGTGLPMTGLSVLGLLAASGALVGIGVVMQRQPKGRHAR
jgi:hypothetical protein